MSDPRITNEAVQALHHRVVHDVRLRGVLTLADARAALEAAVPHLAPQPVSDQCLRDALEKICDDYIAIDIELLRETLAAHPVEPAPPRPVVDREALVAVIRQKRHLRYAWQAVEIADAVLALINNGGETPDDEQPRMTAENYYCPPASIDGED